MMEIAQTSPRSETRDGQANGLELRNITKQFPGVLALDDVSFDIQKGEVHALLGQNGAGKSTLMSVLSGSQAADSGRIRLDGEPVDISDPLAARNHGIAIVHQEFALCPNMTVAENVFIGVEPYGAFGKVDFARIGRDTEKLLNEVQVNIDPDAVVQDLGVSEWQIIEICKAMSTAPEYIIMDEPTAALNEHQVGDLLDVVRRLRDTGRGVVYISHKLSEVLEIADRITVMRDGRISMTVPNQGVTEADLIAAMIGDTFEHKYKHDERKNVGPVVLELKDLDGGARFTNVDLKLRKGEMLGLTGNLGSGCHDLVRSIFGIVPPVAGEIRIHGEPVRLTTPKDAVDAGIGYAPADRKHEGLVLSLSTYANAAMAVIDDISNMGIYGYKKQTAITDDLIGRLSIKAGRPGAPVRNLSGGNQQKVSIAKWLARECKILLFDEPTRGIDVNAKVQIWGLLNELTAEGVSILVVSSELPELLEGCDRIVVMRRGRVVGDFPREEFDEATISFRAVADSGAQIES